MNSVDSALPREMVHVTPQPAEYGPAQAERSLQWAMMGMNGGMPKGAGLR